MIVKYDSLNRFETPQLTLCNPGSVYDEGSLTRAVGIIPNVSDAENVFNFNASSELNFRINRQSDKPEDMHLYNMFRALRNRRLIFEEGIGYFTITKIVDGNDGNIVYKEIQAQSVDQELAQKELPYIEDGTYPLVDNPSTGEEGILNQIVATVPLWTIGYVDPLLTTKYRTFSDFDESENCLGFIQQDIQDAFEAIVLFDCVRRVINVYDQSNYIRETSIQISTEDLVKSLVVEENAEDIYTAISVEGDNNISINAINPLGTRTIYNFDYYLSWMTPELSQKVSAWQNAVAVAQPQYATYQRDYSGLEDNYNTDALELQRLEHQISIYVKCRDNVQASKGDIDVSVYNVELPADEDKIVIYDSIDDTIAELDSKIATSRADANIVSARMTEYQNAMEVIKSEFEAIQRELIFQNYFTSAELDELSQYLYEGVYKDDYIVITDIMDKEEQFNQYQQLYDRAMIQLGRVSTPSQKFDLDTENFVFDKNFSHYTSQLETGCIINVDLGAQYEEDEGEYTERHDIAQLFLSAITINYEDHSLTMTFGNRFNKYDPKTMFEEVLGQINRSANTLEYIKETVHPIKNGELNRIQEALQTSRDLTMGQAFASSNQEITIDAAGITAKRKDGDSYDPHQLKITDRSIVFTDDAWQSSKLAIGNLPLGDGETIYGINAQAIFGDLIMGNNLKILDAEGNEIMSVIDGRIYTQVQAVDNHVTEIEQTAGNIELRVTELTDRVDAGVDHVETTTGYTFDANGLNISKSGEEMRNRLDNTGMYVTRSGEDILTANNEGVTALNLTSRQYLTIGRYSRFEDYDNGIDGQRTACFFIGE